MAFETMIVSREESFAVITLNRPPANAISEQLMRELNDAVSSFAEDDAVRAVIITGAGDKIFCAGADLGSAFSGGNVDLFIKFGNAVLRKIERFPKPVIAAMNGHALGGGLELAAAADIRIAEAHVKIGLPETGLGMVPGWSGTQRLVKRFGAQVVRRMVLGGEMFTAEEARVLGLVDAVAESGTVLAVAKDYAGRIARRGPAALEICKLMIASANGEDNGTAVEALGSMLAAKTGDMKEGVAAFAGKRPAEFKGEW